MIWLRSGFCWLRLWSFFFFIRVLFVPKVKMLLFYCFCFFFRFFFFFFLVLLNFLDVLDFLVPCLAWGLGFLWLGLGRAALDFWVLSGWLLQVFFISFNGCLPLWQRWSRSQLLWILAFILAFNDFLTRSSQINSSLPSSSIYNLINSLSFS